MRTMNLQQYLFIWILAIGVPAAGTLTARGAVTAHDPYIDRMLQIRGIQNPGCLCYCNSALVALCASPALRARLSHEYNPLAVSVRKTFEEMLQPGPALSHLSSGSLHEVNHAVRAFFPQIARTGEQQDSAELVAPLLDHLFESHPLQFSVVPIVDRERVDRDAAVLICRESAGVPPVEAMYIPSIDTEVDPAAADYKGNMVQVKIPEICSAFSLDDFFHGYSLLEHVEVSAIIGNVRNESWLTAEKRRLLLEAGGRNGELPPVLVHVRSRIEAPAPDIMPVYIPRFSETGEKNCTPVATPFLLNVPVGTQGSEFYVLRSVVVHSGGSRQSGHYYTYIPDPSEVDCHGNPVRWVVASDSSPKQVCSWKHVKEDIATQGVMAIYDKL